MFIPKDIKLTTTLPKGAEPVWDDRRRAYRQDTDQPTMAGNTMINTPECVLPVAWLRKGDDVKSLDGVVRVARVEVAQTEAQIMLASFDDRPELGLIDPYQHVLLSGWEMEMHFGQSQMLVEAGALSEAQWHVCEITQPRYRIWFETPQIIQANGIWIAASTSDKFAQTAHMVMHPDETKMLGLGTAALAG